MVHTRILIADDSDLVRKSVIEMLSDEADFEVCGQARDGAETLHRSRELQPDVVLLDIRMPGGNGLETANSLRREFPALKILIMSQHDAAQLLPSALEAGADGCIDKGRIATDLCNSIRALGMKASETRARTAEQ